jgi:hypothetical protein
MVNLKMPADGHCTVKAVPLLAVSSASKSINASAIDAVYGSLSDAPLFDLACGSS